MKPPLIVICGATATGKSQLAIALAQHLKAIILSADSRQVYQGFDIGTAKPTAEEQTKVPHYLLDICQPTETLTLAEYQTKAEQIIESYTGSVLLVGGTGLYIKSIVRGLRIPPVSPQADLRSQLQMLGQVHCYALLNQVDPLAGSKIHPNDEIRTIRALEVYYVTGKPISQQQGESPPPYKVIQIGLDCSPAVLEQRIAHRTEQMLASGLVQEVEKLVNQYGWDLPLLNTLGYAEIKKYLRHEITLAEAKTLIILHTRQFAKRQRTWFRGESAIQWFESTNQELLERVIDYLNVGN